MSKEPKRNVYVGHRYVPKIMGEWDKTETYEGLSIVTNEGTSYTSKKRVPKGIDILNEEYWVVTGNYNAQIEEYRKDVREMEKEVGKKSDQSYVDNLNEKVNTQFTQIEKEVGKKPDKSYVDNLNEKVTTQLAQTVEKEIFYKDIITKRYRYNDETDYYITEIPSTIQLRVGVANDELGTVQSTIDFARDKKATLAFNAGVFNMDSKIPYGIVIKDGEIIKDSVFTGDDHSEVLTINKDGVLSSYDSATIKANDLLEINVTQAVQGFWPIIKNGEPFSYRSKNSFHPLQVIGQKTNGDYVLLTTDGRTQYDKGFNIDDAIEIMLSYGVDFAYNLDGGGSTSTVNKFIKQNKNIDKLTEDRPVSTFLYFSKPVDENNVFDSFEEIAKLKQEINEKIVNLINIESGYLFLKTKKNELFPGIEFYPDGSSDRIGKLRMSESFGAQFLFKGEDGNERTVLRGDYEGIFGIGGKLADMYSSPTYASDCNDVKGTGIFRTNISSINTPVEQDHGYLINFNYTATTKASVQMFVGKDTKAIFYRTINADGRTSTWYNFTSPALSTTDRPNVDTILSGFTMFDLTLNKPIWWNGSEWVDVDGNNV